MKCRCVYLVSNVQTSVSTNTTGTVHQLHLMSCAVPEAFIDSVFL